MKKSIISKSLILAVLLQNHAHADMLDLPDPMAGEINAPVQTEPAVKTPPTTGQTQYAESLRLDSISRRTGGSTFNLDLKKATRLQRLDLRVAVSRVKVHQATLITEAGNRQAVVLKKSAVLEEASLTSSENFSLNERIASIELVLESYTSEADLIVTAVAESEIPKMTLRQSAPPQTTPINVPKVVATEPEIIRPPTTGRSSYRAGDQVLYQTQYLATVTRVHGQGQVEISLNDYEFRSIINESKITKVVNCIEGICQNDAVLYSNREADVINVFANGLAQISLVGGYNNQSLILVRASILRKYNPYQAPARRTVDCLNNFCLDDDVYYGRVIGTIREIYSDGTALISIRGYRDQVVSLYQLRPTRRFLN